MPTDTKLISPGEALDSAYEVLTADCNNLRSSLYKDLVMNALKCKRGELDILALNRMGKEG